MVLRRSTHWARALVLAGGVSAAAGAAVPGQRQIEATVGHSYSSEPLIAHGVRWTGLLSFSRRSAGFEIALEMGPPVGCVPEEGSDAWLLYDRLALTIPPLRIRSSGAGRPLVAINAAQVVRAQQKTAAEAELLLEGCDFEHDEDRKAAQARFEAARRAPIDLTEPDFARRLHTIFAALRATNGFQNLSQKREEGDCARLSATWLATHFFKKGDQCVRTINPSDASEDPLDIVTVSFVARRPKPQAITEIYVRFTRSDVPPPGS
jgi:hypothetical protein